MASAWLAILRLLLRLPSSLTVLTCSFLAGLVLPSMATPATTLGPGEGWVLRWALLSGLAGTMAAQIALSHKSKFLSFTLSAGAHRAVFVAGATSLSSLAMGSFLLGATLQGHGPATLLPGSLGPVALAATHLALLGLAAALLRLGPAPSCGLLAALVWTGDRLSADAGVARWVALIDVGSWLRPLDHADAWWIGLGTLCVWAILLWPQGANRSSSPA